MKFPEEKCHINLPLLQPTLTCCPHPISISNQDGWTSCWTPLLISSFLFLEVGSMSKTVQYILLNWALKQVEW